MIRQEKKSATEAMTKSTRDSAKYETQLIKMIKAVKREREQIGEERELEESE